MSDDPLSVCCRHLANSQHIIEEKNALIESLRREVREQRREIAGLREERRSLLEADRPQPDRPEAIEMGESDRSKPIGAVPPEWLAKPYWVDPPSGWAYGFPHLYDPAADGDMVEWMIRHGYPEKLAMQGLPCTFTACAENGEK